MKVPFCILKTSNSKIKDKFTEIAYLCGYSACFSIKVFANYFFNCQLKCLLQLHFNTKAYSINTISFNSKRRFLQLKKDIPPENNHFLSFFLPSFKYCYIV